MGYHAQLRQFFYDARHNAELHERFDAGQPGPRPAWDPELRAGLPLLSGQQLLFCNVSDSQDIERWLRLADEFGLRIGISNGRDAWEIADVLAVLEVPVILSLSWGEEVDDPEAGADESEEGAVETPEEELDWEYLEPLAVRAEKRREWEETRDGALVLHGTGAPFVFGTDRASPEDLLENLRTLVANGLPSRVALDALTIRAAELLGVEQRLGRVEPGWDATFALWTDDPMNGEAQLAWLFVDGYAHEFEMVERDDEPPAEGLDVSGAWSFEFEDDQGESATGEAELVMDEDGQVTGTLEMKGVLDEDSLVVDFEGRVSGEGLILEGAIAIEDFSIEFEMDLEIEGDRVEGLAAYTMAGFGEREARVVGRRRPGGSASGREKGGRS